MRQPEVKRGGGDQEGDPHPLPGRDHRHHPERRQRDVNQSLKQLALEGLGEEPAEPEIQELIPRFHPLVEVIDHEAEQDQSQVALDRLRERWARCPGISSRRRNVSRIAKPTAKKNCGMIVSA